MVLTLQLGLLAQTTVIGGFDDPSTAIGQFPVDFRFLGLVTQLFRLDGGQILASLIQLRDTPLTLKPSRTINDDERHQSQS
ncbi:hypothetical protein GCM10007158_05080 [Vreelandella hamiltonii]|uniref:Uncharacterized protein n=1 Tax=Halomonas johnsoniae TaxID=502832 RepID=A0ABQ2WB11_9GAMM|nr:hypothetical protein GCM10007158_05080 [Halomonas johnsoniae]